MKLMKPPMDSLGPCTSPTSRFVEGGQTGTPMLNVDFVSQDEDPKCGVRDNLQPQEAHDGEFELKYFIS